MGFYNNFEILCKNKGITPTYAAKEIGITQQAVSMWKKRDSVPKYETLKKIADYFGVMVEELLDIPNNVKRNLAFAASELSEKTGKPQEETQKKLIEKQIVNMEIDKLAEAEKQMDFLVESSFRNISDDLLKKDLLRSYGKLNRRGRIEANLQIARLLAFPQYRQDEK